MDKVFITILLSLQRRRKPLFIIWIRANILVEENESEFVFCDRYKDNRKNDTVKNYFWRELNFILRDEN